MSKKRLYSSAGERCLNMIHKREKEQEKGQLGKDLPEAV